MECSDGSGISSRVYNGREDGVMGSLAARRVAQSDWAGVWEAVIVDLFPGVALRWNSSSSPAALAIGGDTFARGTRAQQHREVKFDLQILQELQADARLTNAELAQRVGLSAAPCWRRVRALEEAGYITVERVGRRNSYRVNTHKNFRHPMEAQKPISSLLKIFSSKK